MYTYKIMIHPNNKQETKIRRTLNKCIECQNIVYDYLGSSDFKYIFANIPSISVDHVRKYMEEEILPLISLTPSQEKNMRQAYYDYTKWLYNKC